MKIKDENGTPIEIKHEKVLAVVQNATKNSPVKSLIMFKGNAYDYMFSQEERETIIERIKGEIKE